MSSPESREDWILREARKRPFAERATFLDGACAGDAALRERLEAVLASPEPSEQQETEVAQPTLRTDLAETPGAAVGQTIGPYKILQKIGEGGCGAVYMAEQEKPVRRRVALKVIKMGMDTKAVIARFEAERQALALMDHPNIAKVLDAGATGTGRPYFVMELVRGIKFTEYCDQNHLGVRQRLELFTPVCQAIQHAHQKGIIHRDIKPSNILVTLHDGVPVPKVIDFGIAKATTDQRLTDKTLFTAYEQFIGTPAYMSPEQAEMSGLDVDTRSDIYSLGVLLYELLTGRTPFDPKELMQSGLEGMRKTIREKDPVRPSTKLHTLSGEELTTTAKRHGVEGPRLASQLRGDLDWIVMKCLEKDRTRRFETANGLAMDIRRYLNNEPVLARPPSRLYELQKAFRRHKGGFIATGSVILALTIGVGLTAWQALRATRAEAEQSRLRQNAEANAQKAVAAQASESRSRERAEAEELAARQRAYASDMNVARQALAESNLGQALALLNRQRPQPGQKDLRGWEWRYLWQQTRSDAVFTLCEEPAEIISLAASPDGQLLAIGSLHQGGLTLWDLRTRKEVVRLAKDELYTRAAFSPVEPILAFASSADLVPGRQRTSLRLWNTASRQMIAELPLDNRCVGLAFAQDGRTLVTSTLGGHITLWQIPSGTKRASYPAEQFGSGPQAGFASTPDLSLAVYALAHGQIRAIDLRKGKELWTVQAAKEFVTALAFSPDGKTLASAAGYTESDIRLWEVNTGKPIGRLEGHLSWVSSLVFWPDGKKLASCSADQTLRTWDVAAQKCLDVLRGHRLEVWRLTLLPDAKTLVSAGKDGTVCVWDASYTHARPARSTLPAKGVLDSGFAADGRSILTLNQRGQVSQWAGPDFQEGTPLVDLGKNVVSSCFSEDGRLLAAVTTNGTLQVWDLTQRILRQPLTNAPAGARAVRFFPGDQELLTWTERDNLLHVWDLMSGVEKQSWPAPPAFASAALSPDGRQCMAVGWEQGFVLRNLVEKSQRIIDLDSLEADVGSYSPDGKLFAIASSLGHARVWDAGTWHPVATLRGFLKGAHTVAFSAEGKRLAIGGGDQEAVKLWDTESMQDVFTLAGQGTGYMGVWFSPDGNTLTWGNQSGVLHVWHAPSWEEIAMAEAHRGPRE